VNLVSIVLLHDREPTYLSDELLVDYWVSLRTKSLLEERQKHRHNDARLQTFSEADKKD